MSTVVRVEPRLVMMVSRRSRPYDPLEVTKAELKYIDYLDRLINITWHLTERVTDEELVEYGTNLGTELEIHKRRYVRRRNIPRGHLVALKARIKHLGLLAEIEVTNPSHLEYAK